MDEARVIDDSNNMELLAPAGGLEAFRAALAAGADAVYCGLGSSFNARRGAGNFTPEEFEAACREAHLAGVRVYVTLNVVVKEDELPRALRTARRAWELGADALIVQDWGLFALLRRLEPQIELHVSTQANVHDARGVAWCAERGATRVTLSRELSLPEMAACAAVGPEVECFGHGAICVCYSGLCLMSSMRGGRSANRGLCAQPCRLPYQLVDAATGEVLSGPGDQRLLCPRDLCYVDRLAELRDAGVASLKVEGRMKAPDYVYAVVGAYREAIDALDGGGASGAAPDDDLHRRLKRAFNRDFTDAYLDGRSGNEMMSYERSNNRGELVGQVVSSRRLEDEVTVGGGSRRRLRRHTRAELTVALAAPVGEGDLLEVRPADDPSQFFTCTAPAEASAGTELAVVGVRTAPAGSAVRVIRSQAAFDAVDAALGKACVRRRPVDVRVTCRLGEPLVVALATVDGCFSAEATGPVVEAARTRAVSETDLAEHAGRLGTTPFEAASVTVELDDGCGLGFSAVHHVRAEAASALEETILAPYAAHTAGHARFSVPEPVSFALREEPQVCALVATPEAAAAARVAGATRLYAPADALAQGGWPDGVIPWLDEVCREGDRARLDPLVEPGRPVGVGNVSELALAAERGALAELRPCAPVHNHEAASALVEAGARGIWLSPELSLDEIAQLAPLIPVPVGIVAWGRARVMTTEHCVLQAAGRCVHDCARCDLRRRDLRLRNVDGYLMPVRTDAQGRSRVWHAWPTDATPQTAELLAAGVTRLMVDCTLLAPGEVAAPVRRAAKALAAVRAGRVPKEREAGTVPGHLFAPIG